MVYHETGTIEASRSMAGITMRVGGIGVDVGVERGVGATVFEEVGTGVSIGGDACAATASVVTA
jgi:hypothetical protein